MKDFLSEYLITLSGKRNTHIQDLLSASRVSKNDLDSLASKLKDTKKDSPIIISQESLGGLIRRATFDSVNRDANRRLLELFNVSNRISLVLDSHAAILTSEIKALEDEIAAMEKAIANYAFTLSDGGFYDYAFTEPFSDDTFRETNISIKLTDRSGIDFSPEEIAVVNGAAGILSLSPQLKNAYPITADFVHTNCASMISSNTGLDRALNADVSNGWRMAVDAPKPITNRIDPSFLQQGAQVELEIFLQAPAPCDTIILTPFSDLSIDVLRVQIYPDVLNATPVSLLDSPITLDQTRVINFPLQPVAKFRVLLNQSIYSRGQTPPAQYEVAYRELNDDIKLQRHNMANYMGRAYNKNNKALKRVFLKAQKQSDDLKIFKSEIPQLDFNPAFGPMTLDKVVLGFNPSNPKQDFWSFKTKANHFMRKMIDEKIFASNPDQLNKRFVFNANQSFISSNSPLQLTMLSGQTSTGIDVSPQQPVSANIIGYPTIQENQYLAYQYNLGLRNIRIGTGERIYRGVFISKQIPAPNDSGEVKIKVDDQDYQLIGTSRDIAQITSIEYSVSNKANPSTEQDWIPILPMTQTQVEGERLFVNEVGRAITRFTPAISGGLKIYKNGYQFDISNVTIMRTADEAGIKSFRFKLGTFSSSDIFTISYTPLSNSSIINFEDKGLGSSTLATAYDDSGAGETFNSTLNNQVVTLKNEPYVDYASVDSSGSYSTTYGFQGSYQPITIVMSDGSIALNQTNYKGITQNDLSTFDESQTAYIHSGKNIIFNKPITDKFTVFYQYLPSTLRFRVVLRVNDQTYVSPSVNSVQVKTKTRKPNPRKTI